MRFLPVWIGIAVVALIGATMMRADGSGKKPETKTVDFTFTDVNGKTVKLSDYRGKVVVIDEWATWCGFCQREIPDLIAMQEQAVKEKKNLQIIGMSVDDEKDMVKEFTTENKINYPVVYATKEALKTFTTQGLPTKFILNEKGEQVDKIIGYLPRAELEKRLAKYVTTEQPKKTDAAPATEEKK
jgi:thiol-disulfide isomerase/thioredoxin